MTKKDYLNIAYRKIPDQTELTKGDLNQLAFSEELHDIMKEGDPVKYILDVFNKNHDISDRKVAELLLLSIGCQSIINSEGIHVSVIGKSGGGKSECCNIMKHLTPPEYIEKTKLTDKAIWRIKRTWKPKTVIFSNDNKLSEEMEEVMRKAIDSFQTGDETYKLVNAKKEIETLKIPTRLTWWLTNIERIKDEPLLNRFSTVNIDESLEKFERIREHQKYKLGLKPTPTKKVKLCRDIIQQIKENDFIVTVPKKLSKNIKFLDDKTDTRRYPMFKNMIKAYAVFNYMQRETRNGKLRANEKDIENAIDLYNAIRGNVLLDEDEKEIWDIIYRQNNPSGMITPEQISKISGTSLTTIRKKIKSLRKKIPKKTIYRKKKTPRLGGKKHYYYTLISPKSMKYFKWVRWIE